MTALATDRVTAEMPLRRNTRTGLILATLAVAFFAGIILKYWLIG